MSLTNRPSRLIPTHRYSGGFSLVEIMVGMVIGLLGIIVMMNLFSNFEAQKRTTSSGSEVQNDAAISLYTIQQDIEQAGYGINTKDTASHPILYGCSILVASSPNPAFPPAAFTLPALAPVTINAPASVVPAGDNNTDTLLIVYGNSYEEPEGSIIGSLGASAAIATNFNTKFQPPQAQINDQVIFEPAVRPTPCNLTLDTVVGTNSTTIVLSNGMQSDLIPIVPLNIGTMFDLGNLNGNNLLSIIGYAIRNGNLTSCNYMRSDCIHNLSNWSPIANGIVSLKAQYGQDTTNPATGSSTPMDGIVDQYSSSTPNPLAPNPAIVPNVSYQCEWMRISSVRIALVGRNSQPDKTVLTNTAPTWAGSTNDPIDLTASTTGTFDWTHYRYKVFQTTIPIRNLALNGAVTGC